MQDTATKSAAPAAAAELSLSGPSAKLSESPAAVRTLKPATEASPPTQSSKPANYYGLQILPPLSAVVELAAIVAVLLAVDWLWPALDINNIQPSPYWLPVLLLTLHYGTASGTLAVIVAIVAHYALVTLPEQGVGENEFAYRLRILSQPILWIATAVLLGQFRMVQIANKRELRRRVEELETQRETLAGYAQRLRTRCDALERDIAARPVNATAPLLSALSTWAFTDPDGIETAANATFAAAFPGAAMSLFHTTGTGGLSRLSATGWPEAPTWPTSLDASHPLTKAILIGKAKLTALDPASDLTLSGQGLAAVPILDPATGKVIGMVKLERTGAGHVTPALIAQLDVLAAAVAPALARLGNATSETHDSESTLRVFKVSR